MATEIRVPALGESVTEAIVGKWFKNAGDAVNVDEPLVELETDKVTVEVPAPVCRRAGRDQGRGRDDGRGRRGAGRHQQRRRGGVTAKLGRRTAPLPRPLPRLPQAGRRGARRRPRARCRRARPRARSSPRRARRGGDRGLGQARAGPQGGRRGGHQARSRADGARLPPRRPQQMARGTAPMPVPAQNLRLPSAANDAAREERVRMTKLRQTIAQRLKDAQNTAAMLTTFNDVDMSAVMKLQVRVQGAVREAPRREARLHGLLRQGVPAGA